MKPSLVIAHGVDALDVPTAAALLVWGHHASSGRWAAGIAFLFRKHRGTALRVLLIMRVPGEDVKRRPGQSYGEVPKIVLVGPVTAWPTLRPMYRGIGAEWRSIHLHVRRPDPEGEYRDVHEAMRNGKSGTKPVPRRRWIIVGLAVVVAACCGLPVAGAAPIPDAAKGRQATRVMINRGRGRLQRATGM